MDVYGQSAPDLFRIDDLLDFTNEDIISSNTTDSDLNHHHHQYLPPPENSSNYHRSFSSDAPIPTYSTDFTDDLCVPNDDVAELEWLSKFVDDSFSYFPANDLTGSGTSRSETSYTGRARSKRSRAASTLKNWTSSMELDEAPMMIENSKTTNIKLSTKSNETSSSSEFNNDRSSSPVGIRRCTHCASEKTPQWRTGPLGPKTLCNACGVRYKSGRLVPEYRPAASPTFVLTQHSNSHRKVMELRRQKEVHRQQDDQKIQLYHHHDFEVC